MERIHFFVLLAAGDMRHGICLDGGDSHGKAGNKGPCVTRFVRLRRLRHTFKQDYAAETRTIAHHSPTDWRDLVAVGQQPATSLKPGCRDGTLTCRLASTI
jgi:hypothetical protein